MTTKAFAGVTTVFGIARLGLAVTAVALCALALAPGAQASHIKGGTLFAQIDGDQASGDAAYYENLGGTPCTVGDPGEANDLEIGVEGPGGLSGAFDVSLLPAICPSNGNIGVWRGTFSADLNTVLGAAPPDGEYVFSLANCCMVAPILNAPSVEEFDVRARVQKQTGQAGHSPTFGNEPRLGIGIGNEFFDSLAPSIPGGGPFSYTSLAGTALGPDTDVVTYHANGTLTIPAATTSTMAVDDAYLYSVRVTHPASGNYSDRSVVLIAGLDDGLPPPPDPDPEPDPEPLSAPKLTVGKAKGLKGAKGFALELLCDRKCTIDLSGVRALRQKTKEPNWPFEPARVDLEAGKTTNVKVAFGKQLRRTIRRGISKGINPIKFQITTTIDKQTEAHVVPIRF